MRRSPAILLLTLISLSAAAADCPAPSTGPADIRIAGYYSDEAKSVRDEAKFKETREASKPFEDFATQLAKQSDRYLDKGDNNAATCAIAWLERWAQDGAMLGNMVRVNNDQSEYVRKWTNATAAIAWNKVRDKASAEQRSRIDGWLKAVSRATLAYWTDNPKKTRNNHYYWTGVGVMATAVATNDAELLAEARQIYEAGLSDIRDDGTLPHEMTRGIRALHYHNFSAMPLAMMAEMARKTRQDWFVLREARLDKLMTRVAAGLRDPAWFDKEAGAAPQVVPPKRDLGWILACRAHAPQGERFDGLFSSDDNSYVRDLGGSVSLIIARGVFDPR
ncbi:alginate lyase family protein [Uliginosibacterium sp. 31-16]|uniref:alginate lyase family protein n=1 Tax=Uliginosibacterium sp. 31-16 TaxID=3068315 RepID=UPI00273E1440|nr:alginate lyase family protein [Uliginosibacterium sp. 31-16]MDP5239326.1 alginate lyase family protein [Uliginosibacterium sp. 31-16]